MKKSKLEAAETRRKIVRTAAAEFRQKGINGTSLADLMAAAGLTHGGFYRHFESKDQLVAEACAAAFESANETAWVPLLQQSKRNGVDALVAKYLSEDHRDDQRGGCPFAALGSELARSDENTRAAATEGLLKLVDAIARQFSELRHDVAKRRALVTLSTMVGSLTLARMVTDSKLSTTILRESAKHVTAKSRVPDVELPLTSGK
jgi:TetR/AcrR family transcriptional regulator, transcriptional repressor for nem operon